ncbi:MAG TPA: heme exporter protein CcmD, partial [Gammaproteobacteria bacterium]|nr:heme exporter protein CcmD [Gammaproteobacteria bacterium]
PTQLAVTTEAIELRGEVKSIQSTGNQHQILLSDQKTQVQVVFNGTLPRQLRTHWGAHVTGTVTQQEEGLTVNATTIAALNIRDHSGYILAAYGIAMIALLLNLFSAMRSSREARQSIARQIRQELNA